MRLGYNDGADIYSRRDLHPFTMPSSGGKLKNLLVTTMGDPYSPESIERYRLLWWMTVQGERHHNRG